MPWTNAYIGIPFKINGRTREGCDCWGLVYLVYRAQLNIDLPDYNGILSHLDKGTAALRRIKRIIEDESRKWIKVDDPKGFDVVLLRGEPYHVGIVCGRCDMLHVDIGINSCVERFTSAQHKNRIIGFQRYVR